MAFDASSRRCSQNPSRPASWMTTTLTGLPIRRSAFSRSPASRSSSARPSPAAMVRLETFSSPGALVATSQDFRLSSSAANRVLSSDRAAVGAGRG